MRLILVCMCALLADAAGGDSGVLEKVSGPESCSQVKLKPAGQCGDEDQCPYQITLPPLTIQLPKQFRLLEKTTKELQSLKETVNQLRSACLECSQQADQSPLRDGTKTRTQDTGDGGTTASRNGNTGNDVIQEMQLKMTRMSASLKNARGQITVLQSRLDKMHSLDLKDVEEVVDSRVANISGMNNLSTSCSTQCAATGSLQRKATSISLH